MYYKMTSGIKGYTLSTSDDVDVDINRRYEKMSDASLDAGRFLMGSDTVSRYNFNLQYLLKL